MTSSADRSFRFAAACVIAAAFAASPAFADTLADAGAATTAGTAMTTPAAVAAGAQWTAHVAEVIASRWNVPASGLRLDWGRLPRTGLPDPSTAFRLTGGTDGWFVLATDAAGGPVAAARVRAGIDDTVCVATRDLARGEHLGDGDLRLESRVRWGAPRPAALEHRPAAGWELRRPVAAGMVVDAPTALPPAIVSAGDHIELAWTRGDIALHLSGVALTGARLGETLRVRVDGRPRPVLAVVDAPGHARLGSREDS